MQSITMNDFESTFGKQERRPKAKDQRAYEGERRHVSAVDKKHSNRQARRNKINLRDVEATMFAYD